MASNPKLFTHKCTYDVTNGADLGTAASHVPSNAGTKIPDNAIVMRCTTYTSVAMVAVGGTPTFTITCGGITLVGTQNCVGHASLADEKVTINEVADKTTAAGDITVVIADQAINAGVIEIITEYYLATEQGA
jgi:hypothetical protein